MNENIGGGDDDDDDDDDAWWRVVVVVGKPRNGGKTMCDARWFAIVLREMTGSADIVIGVPVSCRPANGFENTVGLFQIEEDGPNF